MYFISSMRRLALALVAGILAQYSIATSAQSNPGASPTAPPARSDFRVPDEFTGLIINQTLTPLGQEFYNRFVEFWREKPQYDSYSLVVSERHSKRYGSQISIIYRQRAVFSGNLPFKYGLIKVFSGDAVEKAYSNIISLSLRNTSERDPDIAEDEF